jgi:hypothetical protein
MTSWAGAWSPVQVIKGHNNRRVLEAMILPALKTGGYTYLTQQLIAQRFGGAKHLVDVIAEKQECKYLVSLKWQADGVLAGTFSKAYLVLGGRGS